MTVKVELFPVDVAEMREWFVEFCRVYLHADISEEEWKFFLQGLTDRSRIKVSGQDVVYVDKKKKGK